MTTKEAKPLKLKRQQGATPKKKFSRVAEVLVDHEAFHLDSSFSYGVPEELINLIRVGSMVKVDFRNEPRTGVVISITEEDRAVKPISDLLGRSYYPESMVQLINAVRARYVGSLHQILRFARPLVGASALEEFSIGRGRRPTFHLANAYLSVLENISALLSKKSRSLIICETTSQLETLSYFLGSKGLGPLYKSSRSGFTISEKDSESGYLAIGLRGSIFSSLPNLQQIIIVNESSPHHLEPRRPRWNTRDVALLRQRIEGVQLDFVGTSLSAELARLIDEGGISYSGGRRPLFRNRTRFFFSPETFHQAIRTGLHNGHVLVSVSEKSYSNLILCANCNSPLECGCGGRLIAVAATKLSCNLCGAIQEHWSCRHCQSPRYRVLRKGALRIAEEIGKAFPRTKIAISTAETRPTLTDENTIVISTFGSEPDIVEGFSAVILLDGEALSARPLLRSEENLLFRWSTLIANSPRASAIFISLPRQHRVSQTLLAGTPQRFMRDELANRKILKLPPFSRAILIRASESELSNLTERLRHEFASGIISSSINRGVLVLRISHEDAPAVLAALRALQHYRSARGEELLNIDVDPYDL